jgi:hypothetical protein
MQGVVAHLSPSIGVRPRIANDLSHFSIRQCKLSQTPSIEQLARSDVASKKAQLGHTLAV